MIDLLLDEGEIASLRIATVEKAIKAQQGVPEEEARHEDVALQNEQPSQHVFLSLPCAALFRPASELLN